MHINPFSSVVEQLSSKQEVAGSNPARGVPNFLFENYIIKYDDIIIIKVVI